MASSPASWTCTVSRGCWPRAGEHSSRGRGTRGQGAAGRRGPVARPATRGPRVRAVCAHRPPSGSRSCVWSVREERTGRRSRSGARRPLDLWVLQALVAEHPLRERLRAQLLLTLYRSGRQADVLEAYRDARSALVGQICSSVRLTRRTLMASRPSLIPRESRRADSRLRGASVVELVDEAGGRIGHPGRPVRDRKVARDAVDRLLLLIAAGVRGSPATIFAESTRASRPSPGF